MIGVEPTLSRLQNERFPTEATPAYLIEVIIPLNFPVCQVLLQSGRS